MAGRKISIDFSLFKSLQKDILAGWPEDKVRSTRITDIITSQLFSLVRLSSGHVGFSMNYALVAEGRHRMQEQEKRLTDLTERDPLLFEVLWDFNEVLHPLLRSSLLVSVLSALSKPLLEKAGNFGIEKRSDGLPLERLTRPGDSVAVIGLGGYLEAAMRNHNVETVYLADFYCKSPDSIERIDKLRKDYPDRRLEVSDGSVNEEILGRSQIACITASALANGTLPFLLPAVRQCRSVILQGHSGHVFPTSLFDRGVHYINTDFIGAEFWPNLKAWHDENPLGDIALYLDRTLTKKVTYSRAAH